MYYVITKNGVIKSFNLKFLNKKCKYKLKDDDFRIFGNSKVLMLTDKDISYVKDLHYMSRIPIENLYRKDIRPLILNVVQIIIGILTYSSVMSLIGALKKAVGG